MSWIVVAHPDVDAWIGSLDPVSRKYVRAAIDVLVEEGPNLGRPLVDRIRGSRFHNLKELRPGSHGLTEVRVLFAFDPQRRAVLLLAGDKTGRWRRWYAENIPRADQRFAEHLADPERNIRIEWKD